MTHTVAMAAKGRIWTNLAGAGREPSAAKRAGLLDAQGPEGVDAGSVEGVAARQR